MEEFFEERITVDEVVLALHNSFVLLLEFLGDLGFAAHDVQLFVAALFQFGFKQAARY